MTLTKRQLEVLLFQLEKSQKEKEESQAILERAETKCNIEDVESFKIQVWLHEQKIQAIKNAIINSSIDF